MAYLNVPINKISTQRPVRTTGIFYAAACENRLLFPFRKERSCEHWRKSKAIQAYGALRKSFTLSTTFSSRSPPHVQSNGMVRGIAVRGDSFWGATALFLDWRCVPQILWNPRGFYLVRVAKDLWREKAFWIPKVLCQLSAATKSDLCWKGGSAEKRNIQSRDYNS